MKPARKNRPNAESSGARIAPAPIIHDRNQRIQTLVRMTPDGYKECRFEQSPPPGSKFVGDPTQRKDGSILFETPTGEWVLTPAIWYTLPWKCRIEHHRFWIEQRWRRRSEQIRAGLIPASHEASKKEVVDFEERMEQAIRHIERHADLEQCPALNPIPDAVSVDMEYHGRDYGWFGIVRCGSESESVEGENVDVCWKAARAWLSRRNVKLGNRPKAEGDEYHQKIYHEQ